MGMEAIYDDTMEFSAMKSQGKLAMKCVEYLKMAIAGETPQNKSHMLQPIVIKKDNVLTVRDAAFGGTVTNPSTWKPTN